MHIRSRAAAALGLLLAVLTARAEPPVVLDPLTTEGRSPELRLPAAALDLPALLLALPGVQLRRGGGLGAYAEASLRGGSARQARVLLDGVPLLTPGGAALNLSLLPAPALGGAQVDHQHNRGLSGDLLLRARKAERALHATAGQYGLRALTWAQPLTWGGRGAGSLTLHGQQAQNDFPLRNPLKPFDPADPERRAEEPRQNAATRQYALLYRQPGQLGLLSLQREHIPNPRNSRNNGARLDTRLAQWAAPLPATGGQWRLGLLDERFRDAGADLVLAPSDRRSRTWGLGWERDERPGADFWRVDLTAVTSEDARRANSAQRVGRYEAEWAREWQWPAAESTPESAPDSAPGSGPAPGSMSRHTPAAGPARRGASLGVLLWGESGDAARGGLRLAPAAGLTQALPWGGWQAQAQYRERLPTVFERYGDRGLFRGNPGLDSERALSGALNHAGARGPQFSAYLRLLRDAITPQYNAQGLGRAVNAGRAQVWGLSLADRHALGPALSLRWRADWLQARDRGDGAHAGRRLPGRPQWQAHAQLDWQRGPWALRYAFAFESGAYYDSPNLLPAPVLRSHDLLLRWSAGRWALRAEARNLGDNRHARFNGFAEPGRQVWFGLSYAHP